MCGVDIGFDGVALGEVAPLSVDTCVGEDGGILNFRGRVEGVNVLVGKRLPTLRKYGRLDCCLTATWTSCVVEELEAARPFFASGVSASTVTSWVNGYRTTLGSDVHPLGATRGR